MPFRLKLTSAQPRPQGLQGTFPNGGCSTVEQPGILKNIDPEGSGDEVDVCTG